MYQYPSNYQQLGSAIDKTGILEQLNPENDINRIIYSLLGLTVIKSYENKTAAPKIKRVSRPLFTYEYVLQLRSVIEGYLSYTTQVSRWENQRVMDHTREALLTIMRNLAVQGDDNYVSERSWSRIKEIAYSKPEGKGWSEFGINWTYDEPVSNDILLYVRESDEESEQTLFFAPLLREIAAIIEGSLNKGYAAQHQQHGMLPAMLGEMRQETTVVRETSDKKPGSLTGGDQGWA